MDKSDTDNESKKKMLEKGGKDDNDTVKKDEERVNLTGLKTDENNLKEKAREKHHYKLGIFLFGVLDLLLLALIIITLYYMSSEQYVEKSGRDIDICLPCKDLKIHPDDQLDEGIERRGENKSICCVKEEENSDVLVSYFIDHWMKEKLANDERPFTRYECTGGSGVETRRPIIKLVGKDEKQSSEHSKVIWDGTSETAIVPADGIITHYKEDGFIEIKKRGLYQVYSQVVIDHDMLSDDPQKSPSIYQHSVVHLEAGARGSRAREREILKASNSHCATNTTRQTVTSYLGGAFQLVEGDKLAVKVHNKTEIVPVAHMNFFGVHML